MERPEIDLVTGLPPTVAIEQRISRGGGKSTVATITEVYHFLRLLYSKLGTQYCPACHVPVATTTLAEVAETLQGHLDRSNFALELHQAFLDLVVAGTGVLSIEEAPPGEPSALRFRAVPLREAVLEEGASGRLDTVFRALRLTPEELRLRFPRAALPPSREEDGAKFRVVEAAWPDPRSGHCFAAVLDTEDGPPVLLASGLFAENPFVAFRWLKLPGETYGRGPVAKALPDIRTANKVVELILKNASIAATGIWQADRRL
jgi:hypothetical protein